MQREARDETSAAAAAGTTAPAFERDHWLIVLGVVAAFVVASVFLMRGLTGASAPPADRSGAAAAMHEGPRAGTQVDLPGVEWARGERTLLVVLSKGCRFCTESARFYRRLAREAGESGAARIVAVLPQDETTGREYLEELRVDIPEVRSARLDALGVPGTPTLILVDRSGKVLDSWVGLLPPNREEQVVNRVLGKTTA